jgi:hypothetical protein
VEIKKERRCEEEIKRWEKVHQVEGISFAKNK